MRRLVRAIVAENDIRYYLTFFDCIFNHAAVECARLPRIRGRWLTKGREKGGAGEVDDQSPSPGSAEKKASNLPGLPS